MSRAALHLVSGGRPVPLGPALRADRAAGREPIVVAMHDGVLGDTAPAARSLADDCRRRGLSVPGDALEYDDLVDLIASAERVVSW